MRTSKKRNRKKTWLYPEASLPTPEHKPPFGLQDSRKKRSELHLFKKEATPQPPGTLDALATPCGDRELSAEAMRKF
jgi:hypothetical protein